MHRRFRAYPRNGVQLFECRRSVTAPPARVHPATGARALRSPVCMHGPIGPTRGDPGAGRRKRNVYSGVVRASLNRAFML
ncbi:hypothetical protein GCM10010215_30760 [Streptomyces virginiae]|uniref:Uncharacterized protein n=1 Tax=Streptomyces virginiae TaxID=1961 RepID=A0ABQ3NIR6_STRVG|nr:hypothetical protein GCM10010215_30760 [Streptomyces virginiae]GHI12642.1 hypothetical protein Scinn_21050 [Streptomyces virginiae]GLV95265.1 hypothetical protein Slala04_67180 [Streptomyces lavendulae subsp. lavendulae]